MLDFALAHARGMGFETEDHDGHCGSAIYGDRENDLAIIAHIDIVPEGGQWLYPPFGATRKGDFLIGRGTNDDKNAAVMGLYLMRMFRELGTPLKHGLARHHGLLRGDRHAGYGVLRHPSRPAGALAHPGRHGSRPTTP